MESSNQAESHHKSPPSVQADYVKGDSVKADSAKLDAAKADSLLEIIFRDGGKMLFSRPHVMGILNATPDSFFDGGLFFSNRAFLKKVDEMLMFGVDIIDIGGESSRPGAKPVSLEEERTRVIPKLKKLKKKYPHVRVSVDTRNEPIAREAIDCGVDIINDISSGDDSNNAMLELVAQTQTPILLMHKKGQPQTMQDSVTYDNVKEEVFDYLKEKIILLKKLGLNEKKIIIDVGIGFGKEQEHNVILIKNLSNFKKLGQPILLGASMKSLITYLTDCEPEDRLPGTLSVHLAAIVQGANIIRVHDVKSARYSIESFFPILRG